ncbi:MAG: DNA polymerase III subunit delta' [Pyrinomonadaceae bacterium]
MFDSLVGNSRVKELLRRMLQRQSVPGALLFAGPEGVGKRLFALQLAKAAVCRDLRDGEACDVCAACVRVMATNPPSNSDKDADKKLTRTDHSDVVIAQAILRSIRVDQIRDLEREAQYRPVEGRARYFLVDDAHLMQEQASNALLKTLEEPTPTTRIILITSRPASLLVTIRSRSQMVRFTPIAREEIRADLVATANLSPADATLLSGIAAGSLGRARSLDLDQYRSQRDLMLDALTAVSVTPDRARVLRVAEEICDPKRKDDYESHLDVLETLAVDVLHALLDGSDGSLVNEDVRPRIQSIARQIDRTVVSKWIQQIEALRGQLKVNVNRKVASDALFLSMMVAA